MTRINGQQGKNASFGPVQVPAQRELGWDSGLNFWMAEDFDEYLPEEFAEYVE
ncbi:MAG: hypothetical protein WA304_00545 [Candidatus Cybelea sp.]